MPDTPIYGITYPCVDVVPTLADFSVFATDVEAVLATLDAEASSVTHLPTARGLGATGTALGVEAILTFTSFPATVTATGITLNAAAGTFTIITPGFYVASANLQGNQSTLTMTSQRVAVYLNGVFVLAKKTRGENPATAGATVGSFTAPLKLAAGDVVTFRYLWTGTGALSGVATSMVSLSLMESP